MKTTIRTYHPIPALQRTNENLQDAPRIKHILKTSLMQGETKSPPTTPADIVARCVSYSDSAYADADNRSLCVEIGRFSFNQHYKPYVCPCSPHWGNLKKKNLSLYSY